MPFESYERIREERFTATWTNASWADNCEMQAGLIIVTILAGRKTFEEKKRLHLLKAVTFPKKRLHTQEVKICRLFIGC